MRRWDRRTPTTTDASGQGPRWSEDEARSALAEWRRSGETAVAFAAARGVSPQRLFYWRKRLGEPGSDAAFVEVDVATTSRLERREIEIAFAHVRVRIREDVEAAHLARIVRALAREE